jgi:hypothetical protein
VTIAFIFWPGNTEVQLLDDEGRIEDRFYTACRKFGFAGHAPLDAKWFYEFLEEMMPAPIIGGSLSAYHPYWLERKIRREARETGKKLKSIRDVYTEQQIATGHGLDAIGILWGIKRRDVNPETDEEFRATILLEMNKGWRSRKAQAEADAIKGEG